MAQTGEVRPDEGRVHQSCLPQINPHPLILRSPRIPDRYSLLQYREMLLVGHLSSGFADAGIYIMITRFFGLHHYVHVSP